MSSTPTPELPLHLVERQQECKGRELQRMLLQAHVQTSWNWGRRPRFARHPSDRFLFLYTPPPPAANSEDHLRSIDIDRMAYSHDGASSIHPLDQAMQLPACSFSYELQKRLVKAAVQGPFRESTERTHEFSGLSVPKRSLEQIVQEAAQDFDAFYAQRPPEPSQPAASILVVAVDCKGIPIVQPQYTKLPAGLAQGPKTNRKQMATVAAVFTREPWIRTPEQVVASLFRIDTNPGANPSPPPRPQHKRVWASLLKGKEAVINEVVLEVQRRDPGGCKTLVALTDGERALQILVCKKLKATLILDLLHVLEKVWKAAHVFHPEGSPDAEVYARLMCLRILEGNVSQVIKGLRQTVTKRRLFGAKRKTLLQVTDYLQRNAGRMRYLSDPTAEHLLKKHGIPREP